MEYLTIEGVKPYDGRYEFALRDSAFSVREWGWVKRHSGYLPLTIGEGLAGSDAELMAVFAIIALVRAGKVEKEEVDYVWERFADAPGVVSIRLEIKKEKAAADDAGPPPQSSTSSTNGSGDASETSSGRSDEPPPTTGTPASVTSGSPQAT